MNCSACGAVNRDNALYCDKCSRVLSPITKVESVSSGSYREMGKTAVDAPRGNSPGTVVEKMSHQRTVMENRTVIEGKPYGENINNEKKTVVEGGGGVRRQDVAPHNQEATIIVGSIAEAGNRTLQGWLVCIEGGLAERDFPFYSGKNSIGRNSKNDIFLNDQTVSSEHAVLWCDEKVVTVADKDSKNGILVNGNRIFQATPLSHHDVLTIGDAVLQFVIFTRKGTAE